MITKSQLQYPFEFAKTRTQLQATRQANPLAILSHVARNDGVRAIYTGCSTLILVRSYHPNGLPHLIAVTNNS